MPVASYSRAPLYAAWSERYEVVRKIGSGGFAKVYEALDRQDGTAVALKVIEEQGVLSARVAREVEAAAALDHPGIVGLLDFFTDGRRSFLVWELVRGESLAELRGELDDREAVLVAAQLHDALAYAHAGGIVHRDIKPQNVMLDEEGAVKVMDFGIARIIDAETLTSEGEMLGTVAYMSPEQAAGRRVGPASDVYSASVLLYELLAGENPVKGATAAETIGNVVAGRIAPLVELRPDLPRELCDLVDAGCALRPAERPPAHEMAAALRDAAERVGSGRRHGRRLSLESLLRGTPIVQRSLGAVIALSTTLVVLDRLPAYPGDWALPLAVAAALLWFVLPAAGLAWLLGVLVFPCFDVSFSAGAAYLVFALAVQLGFRRRPLQAAWGPLAVLLVPVFAVLLAPCAAAFFGRRRGPLTAAWSGAVVFVVLSLAGARTSPFAGYGAERTLGLRVSRAGDPLTVVREVGGAVLSWPCLLQMGVWAGLALVFTVSLRRTEIEVRLWAWSLAFCATFVVYRVAMPALGWRATGPGELVASVAVAAVVMLAAVAAAGRVDAFDAGDRRDEDAAADDLEPVPAGGLDY